jgi:hypothetical protein
MELGWVQTLNKLENHMTTARAWGGSIAQLEEYLAAGKF